MNASDSPNAKVPTIGAAHASWARANSTTCWVKGLTWSSSDMGPAGGRCPRVVSILRDACNPDGATVFGRVIRGGGVFLERPAPDFASLHPGYRRLEGWQRVGNCTAAYPIAGHYASTLCRRSWGCDRGAILLIVLFGREPYHIGAYDSRLLRLA